MLVARNWAAALWDNPLLREFVLAIAAAVGVQLALGLNDLLGAIELAKSWGDLLSSLTAWGGAISFALVVTAVKQAIVFGIQQLGGVKR